MAPHKTDRSTPKSQLIAALSRREGEGGAPHQPRHDQASFGDDEDLVLRRLGAAVILRWNDLPTRIQRELFDHAISTRDVGDTVQLKERVARFLHLHKKNGRSEEAARTHS